MVEAASLSEFKAGVSDCLGIGLLASALRKYFFLSDFSLQELLNEVETDGMLAQIDLSRTDPIFNTHRKSDSPTQSSLFSQNSI